MRTQRQPLIWATGLTSLALLVRFYHIGIQSLWSDELLTLQACSKAWNDVVLAAAVNNSNTPMFFWITKLFLLLPFSIEFNLRFSSAVFGALTIPVAMAIAQQLVPSKASIPRLTGLMLAINPLHVWFSQESRPYAMVTFFATASFWWWLKTQERHQRRDVWLLATWLILAFLCHKIGIIICGVLFVLALMQKRKESIVFTTRALLIAAIVIIPVLVMLSCLPPAHSIDRAFTGIEIPYTGYVFLAGFSFGPSVAEIQAALANKELRELLRANWAPLLGVIGLGCSFVFCIIRRPKMPHALITVGTVMQISAVCIVSIGGGYAYNVRYVLPILPLVFLGLSHYCCDSKKLCRVTCALWISVSLLSLGQWFYNPRYAKSQARSIASILQADDTVKCVWIAPAYTAQSLIHYRNEIGGNWRLACTDEKNVPLEPSSIDTVIVSRQHHIQAERKSIEDFQRDAVSIAQIYEYRILRLRSAPIREEAVDTKLDKKDF